MNSNSQIQVCLPRHVVSYATSDIEQNSSHQTQHRVLPSQIPANSTVSLKDLQVNKLYDKSGERKIDSKNLNNIPTRYQHVPSDSYWSSITTNRVKYFEEVKKDPNNFSCRYQLATYQLLTAEMYRYPLNNIKDLSNGDKTEYTQKSELFLNKVKRESQELKVLNGLNPLSYYIDCLILEYKGVDCTDMAQVEEYVCLLKLCLALDPQAAEIQQNLNEVKEFLQDRWSTLEKEGTIEATTHNAWQQKLKSILPSDPKNLNDSLSDSLKNLFRSKPNLFNLARQTTHTTFFAQHPELKSKQAFVARYPECAKELGVELPKPAQAVPAAVLEKENTASQKDTYIVKTSEKWKEILAQQNFAGIQIKMPDGSLQYIDANVNFVTLTHPESNFLNEKVQQLIAQKS